MIPFMTKVLMYIQSMMGSCVSCTVVKMREAVPAQFKKEVMKESWPVDLLENVV